MKLRVMDTIPNENTVGEIGDIVWVTNPLSAWRCTGVGETYTWTKSALFK